VDFIYLDRKREVSNKRILPHRKGKGHELLPFTKKEKRRGGRTRRQSTMRGGPSTSARPKRGEGEGKGGVLRCEGEKRGRGESKVRWRSPTP